MKAFLCTALIAVAGAFLASILSCESQHEKEEKLARRNCAACHVFPDALLLDKHTWEKGVLPEMGFRMAIPGHTIKLTTPVEELPMIFSSIPGKPLVTGEEWQSIKNYFILNAPDSLHIPDVQTDSLRGFSPAPFLSLPNAAITLLQSDSTKFYAGTRYGGLYITDVQSNKIDYLKLESAPSHLITDDEGLLVLEMGIMDPNDLFKGKLIRITKDDRQTVIIDSLQRPSHFEKTDLNDDGHDDIIISAFGNYTGALLLYEGSPDGYIQHKLSASPGTRRTIVLDLNKDNRKDILALHTQGDERVTAYINKGKMQFERKVLLRFPPVYGSSYFELADFNHDGHLDILYTNGDNADYSQVLKPYHGVRIFENDGKNNFREAWFFPMHGASMAMTRDFDKDGDMDIAAVAFFPDFTRHPEQGFIYFENTGGYTFKAQTTHAALAGRWLLMEIHDHDVDNNPDIILGALNFKSDVVPPDQHARWLAEKSSLLILKNDLLRDIYE